MRHIEAGLVVGGGVLAVCLIVVFFDAVFRFLGLGEPLAGILTVGAVVVAVGTVVMDYVTERRKRS